MNPLMSEIFQKLNPLRLILHSYNETKENPYLFNVAAFNDTTMDWGHWAVEHLM